jgi:hypothetical protein
MTDSQKIIDELKGIQRIVINNCYGGFGLSDEAQALYKDMAGITDPDWYDRDIARDDPYLVKIVRDLGDGAGGGFAKLKIVEVPADVEWEIAEYDGVEWVAEKHRTWS